MPAKTTLLLALALVIVTGSGRARAQSMSAEVSLLYEAAKRDLVAGELGGAIEKFRDLLKKVQNDDESSWNALLGLAQAYERAREPLFALATYGRFLRETEARRDTIDLRWLERRQRVSGERIPALEDEVLKTRAIVLVESVPPDAVVTLDGVPILGWDESRTPVTAYVSPGPHGVHLAAPNCRPHDLDLHVKAGTRRQTVVTLLPSEIAAPAAGVAAPPGSSPVESEPEVATSTEEPIPPEAAPKADALPEPVAEPESPEVALPPEPEPPTPRDYGVARHRRASISPLWPWLTGGVGLLCGAGGGVLLYLASKEKAKITGADRADDGTVVGITRQGALDAKGVARIDQSAGLALLGVGAGALVTSAVLWWSPWDAGQASVTVVPTVDSVLVGVGGPL